MKLRDLLDLMNHDYDQDDPKLMGEVQLKVYNTAKKRGKAEVICDQLKDNMVMDPQTIGLPKENSYFKGMEEAIATIDQAYISDHEVVHESPSSRTR